MARGDVRSNAYAEAIESDTTSCGEGNQRDSYIVDGVQLDGWLLLERNLHREHPLDLGQALTQTGMRERVLSLTQCQRKIVVGDYLGYFILPRYVNDNVPYGLFFVNTVLVLFHWRDQGLERFFEEGNALLAARMLAW
jgi:hypothetical protein